MQVKRKTTPHTLWLRVHFEVKDYGTAGIFFFFLCFIQRDAHCLLLFPLPCYHIGQGVEAVTVPYKPTSPSLLSPSPFVVLDLRNSPLKICPLSLKPSPPPAGSEATLWTVCSHSSHDWLRFTRATDDYKADR